MFCYMDVFLDKGTQKNRLKHTVFAEHYIYFDIFNNMFSNKKYC